MLPQQVGLSSARTNLSMANFQKYPSGEKLSGANLVVDGDSITIGLAGYKDFQGQDLFVTNEGKELSIFPGDVVGNVKLYKLVVNSEARATKTSISDRIYANTVNWQNWDKFDITFRFQRGEAVNLVVRPVTGQVYGGDNKLWRGTEVPSLWTVDVASFKPGTTAPLNFLWTRGQQVKVAAFAAKLGFVERAFILMVPFSGKPSKLLIVITHGFGQQDAYYMSKGYTDPLSPDLIMDVTQRFVLERWGAQLMAASSDYALLLPVRAKAGGQGELGPFISQANVGTNIVGSIMAQSDGAFGVNSVELVTFSSGIYDADTFLAVGGKGLRIQRGCNQDPAGGAEMARSVPVRKQYLSGMTTRGPRPGFEYLPLDRWQNEPKRKNLAGMDTFNYLHTWCIPTYTLYMAMAGP
jgi:hypothetical protein